MQSRIEGGPRLFRQRDHYSCGPIALMNLHKFQGLAVTYKHLPRYRRLCGCDKTCGTLRRNFARAIGRKGRRMCYAQFKRQMRGGCALVHTPPRPGKHGHFWFIAGIVSDNRGRKGFLAVNLYQGETLSLVSWARMRRELQHCFVWVF